MGRHEAALAAHDRDIPAQLLTVGHRAGLNPGALAIANANLDVLEDRRRAPSSKTRKAVSSVFSGLAESWGSKAQLIETRGGISDRAIRYLLDDVRPGSRVLDLGAGDGKVATALLAAHPTVDLTLVDCAPGMVAALGRRFGGDPRVRIIQADLHSVETALSQDRFDFVVLLQVLHHISRPKPALRVAASLLAEDGRLVILTVGSAHQEAIFPKTARDGLGRRRPSAWVGLAEEAGLKVDVMYRDESWFGFPDGHTYARFLHRIGSLEKLGNYKRLHGHQLDLALMDAAKRAGIARCTRTGKVIAKNEYVTIVARRGPSFCERR